MADMMYADMMKAGSCNETCGCPSPCPGGQTCRCTSSGGGSGAEMTEHMRCSCGEHCGCNPCKCSKEEVGVAGVGKNHCKCAQGCGCVTCASQTFPRGEFGPLSAN